MRKEKKRETRVIRNIKPKRAIEVIVLGWAVITFSAYIFYKSILILNEYFMLPFSLADILTKGTIDFKINFFGLLLIHVLSLFLFIAGVGTLYLKRWAIILLISVFILDIVKKFYVMSMLAYNFSIIFIIEIILLLLTIYCFFRRQIRQTLS